MLWIDKGSEQSQFELAGADAKFYPAKMKAPKRKNIALFKRGKRSGICTLFLGEHQHFQYF